MATTTTTSEAARAVASNLHARRQQAAADARDQARAELDARNAADALNDPARYTPADTTTPLVGRVPLEQLPDPPAAPAAEPAAKPARSITLATRVTYRDYEITITATGWTLDQFCDMIDRRLGVVVE